MLASGQQLLMLATTLDKLILGARPFWGGKHGPIRATVLPYPVPASRAGSCPSCMAARNAEVPAGAVSFFRTELAIQSPVTFVIDGEFFEPPEDEPLRVETGPVFTYIRG